MEEAIPSGIEDIFGESVLQNPVSILSLRSRTLDLLQQNHIYTLNDLVQMRVSDFVALDGMSDGTVRAIAKELDKFNLSFAPEPGKEVSFHHNQKVRSDKYRKKVLRFTLQFNIKDAEAREWFEGQPDKGAYLKKLILEDKARHQTIEEFPATEMVKPSLSNQILLASTRAADSHSSDNAPVKVSSAER